MALVTLIIDYGNGRRALEYSAEVPEVYARKAAIALSRKIAEG